MLCISHVSEAWLLLFLTVEQGALGFVCSWLPRIHQETRAVAAGCRDNAHPLWEDTHIVNTWVPEVPALSPPLSLPQSEVLLALYRSVSSSIFMKTFMKGSCCTGEKWSAFMCGNPELPSMVYQSYRWHACLNISSPHLCLWVESSIYATITYIVFVQIHNTNTMYFLWVLWWEVLALLVLHHLWSRYKFIFLNWTFCKL